MSVSPTPTDATETIPTIAQQQLLTINMTHVTKLTATNYLMWKIQVHALLNGYDLAGHVDGSLVVPAATITNGDTVFVNPDYTMWKRQDQLIFSSLIGTISPSLQPLLSRATSTYEIWDTLALTYAKPRRGHIKQLKTQLKNWRKESKTIDVYLQGITTRLDQLAILGSALGHEDQIDLILEGLSEEYKPVVDQVEGRDTPPTITELHERLLNHEAKLLSAAAAIVPHVPVNANVAQHHRNNNNYRNQNQNRHRNNQNQWQQSSSPTGQNQSQQPRSDYQGPRLTLVVVRFVVFKDMEQNAVLSFHIFKPTFLKSPVLSHRGNQGRI
ncbi:unnamed protein product [Microthlaspi erraticum]|uniref:Retrotransposon Copia-like N-terminal domain-containing protein n=1 Tax=Microthlaspi erraticum TaxID=1685480 RepID=A0A6D2IPK1_9BRAS|nr:unnamed protein product [Microthlaspi erraticum]